MGDYFDENDENSHWPEKMESVRKFVVTILWLAVISVSIFVVLRYLPDPPNNPQPSSSKSISIYREPSKKDLDEEVIKSLSKAREKAMAQAKSELDIWVESLMVKVDDDFLNWYFGYWTQQKMQIKNLFHNVFHLIYSRHPTAETKILQDIGAEFEKRVLQQGLAQKELEVIAQKSMNQYVMVLRQELNLIAKRHKIPRAEWERYLEDISLLSKNLQAKRTVPLALKGIISYGSGMALSSQIKLMTEGIREKMGMNLATKGATGKAVKVAGKAAGKVMGKLLGPVIIVATVGWDVWDHSRIEKEYRSILKENIRSYFLLVSETMLNDRDGGIMGLIQEMEKHVLESMQAGQAE